MKHQTLFIVFALVIIQRHQGRAEEPDEEQAEEFEQTQESSEQVILVQQWLPTLCAFPENDYENFCSVVSDYEAWSISEFYLSNSQDCADIPLNNEEIENLKEDLTFKWVDVVALNDSLNDTSYLWEEKWKKDGTCTDNSEKTNAQLDYFSNALALFDRYNMSIELEVIDINPGNEYSYNDIKTKLEESIGNKIQIECIRYPESKELDPDNLPKQYLSEIRLCFEQDFETLIDCEIPPSQSCLTSPDFELKITYPAAPQQVDSPTNDISAEFIETVLSATDVLTELTQIKSPILNTPIIINQKKSPTSDVSSETSGTTPSSTRQTSSGKRRKPSSTRSTSSEISQTTPSSTRQTSSGRRQRPSSTRSTSSEISQTTPSSTRQTSSGRRQIPSSTRSTSSGTSQTTPSSSSRTSLGRRRRPSSLSGTSTRTRVKSSSTSNTSSRTTFKSSSRRKV